MLTMIQAIGFTLIGVVFSAGLYLAWGAAGKALVGNFPFFWMDEAEVGSKGAVAVYCTGFLLLAPTSKGVNYPSSQYAVQGR